MPGVRTGRHYRAECANVKKLLAHPVACKAYLRSIPPACRLSLCIYMRVGDRLIEVACVFNKYAIRCNIIEGKLNKISDSTFECYVGYEAMHIFWVDSWAVPCVWVTIRVAIFAIEQIKKLIAVFDCSHCNGPFASAEVSDSISLFLARIKASC
uniref:Uncharacterized protein n=1 Tax=mine drainage metagenome TaxID=410659 RepID=E6PG19_9ZZZZ